MRERDEFPWLATKPGGYFFILSLDVQDTAYRGLRTGHALLGINAKLSAKPGVFKGHLGVLFHRRH